MNIWYINSCRCSTHLSENGWDPELWGRRPRSCVQDFQGGDARVLVAGVQVLFVKSWSTFQTKVHCCATVTVVGPDCQSVTGDRLTGLILKMLVKVLNLQLRSIVVFSYCYGDRRTWLQVYKNIWNCSGKYWRGPQLKPQNILFDMDMTIFFSFKTKRVNESKWST